MNHQLQSNDSDQLSELSSGARDVVLKSEEIEIAKRYDEPISRHGVKMRKVTTTKLVPRRTFIKGTFKGKYWGEYENNEISLKDVGQFYDINLYESEIFVDREVIRTGDTITFSDFLAGISETNSFTSYHHVDPSQLKNNVLVVNHEGSVSRYKIDLHEPRLYNTKIVHALHQSSDQEVFGSIESDICGYLLDKKEVIEESYEVVEDIPNTPIPPVPPTPPIIPALDDAREPERENIRGYLNNSDPELHKNKTNEHSKLWGDNWWLLPLLLILLLCLLAFAGPSNNGLWILPIAALLFFAFQKSSFRLPNWVYAILFLFIGIMLWNAFKHNPPIISTISDLVNRSFDGGNEKDKRITSSENSGEKLKGNVKDQTKTSTSNETTNIVQPESVVKEEVPSVPPPIIPEKTEATHSKTVDKSDSPSEKLKSSKFDAFLNKGLQAVEDEEYALANKNFRQAFKISPRNPRLTELANEFSKTAEQKCQEIKSANAKSLAHIPNNYYQYAASLTQTIPLKCE